MAHQTFGMNRQDSIKELDGLMAKGLY